MASLATSERASVVDVALKAGVSVGTVSNVLNRPERVAHATLRRVQKVIDELQYVPNSAARQLRQGTSKTVGAIVHDLANPFFMDIARGLQDRLEMDDWTMMLAASDSSTARETRFLDLFEEQGVSGIAIVRASECPQRLQAMLERGIGVVMLDSPRPCESLSWVAVDDHAGGRMVIEHMLGLGHTRFAMLNGTDDQHKCPLRRAGAIDALEAAGLDPEECFTELTVPTNADGGGLGVHRLLALPEKERPTAIFGVNDFVALGAIKTLKREGYEAPRDFAIAGFDDAPFASSLQVPLTTVSRPAHMVGSTAASLLLRPPGSPAEQVIYAPQLVVRASTAGY
jgi:LacI family transcriptional regulator